MRLKHIVKRHLLNEKGNLGAHLGADLFVTLLLVFLISTAILLKTAKEEEIRTPEINLAKENQGGLSAGSKGATSVSAKRKADGSVDYFVGGEKTDLQGMAGLLTGKGVRRVELRLGEDLTNAVTVRVLGQFQKANVKEIYYVFIKKQEGGS